jgi:hypothetical protein
MQECTYDKDLLANWARKRGVVSFPILIIADCAFRRSVASPAIEKAPSAGGLGRPFFDSSPGELPPMLDPSLPAPLELGDVLG